MQIVDTTPFKTKDGQCLSINGNVYIGSVYGDNCKTILESPIEMKNMTRVAAKRIGGFTYFNGKCNMGCIEEIGRFCSVAENVICGMPEHPTTTISSSPIFSTFNKNAFHTGFHDLYEDENWIYHEIQHVKEQFSPSKRRRIIIGNDVWIGYGVIINRGVTIGDGAVIGAGSVVTKDVPPYTIVAGTPAKIIKMRFDESQIDKLTKLKWWKYGPNILKNLSFVNIDSTIESLEERIYIEKYPLFESIKFEVDPINNTIQKI